MPGHIMTTAHRLYKGDEEDAFLLAFHVGLTKFWQRNLQLKNRFPTLFKMTEKKRNGSKKI